MKHQPVMKPQTGDEPSSQPEPPGMEINHQLLMKPPNVNETQTRPETSQQMKYGMCNFNFDRKFKTKSLFGNNFVTETSSFNYLPQK
jgi:hypothetical protein